MSEIKICGLFRECDIDYVNEAMPEYAGFIINFPKSHRNLSPTDVGRLTKKLNPEIRSVGVFVNQSIEFICDTVKETQIKIVQLHGDEDNTFITRLRARLQQEFATPPHIWKAFRISGKKDLEKAENSRADEILLDNGYGCGNAFDWSVLTHISRPYILAGGLTPENIKEAKAEFYPFCFDISSGVETEKKKDKEKIIKAVEEAHKP